MTTIDQPKQRDVSLDVAKGICIILMVIGHAGCPGWLKDFIYMFHMPLFFFVSGMLLSERYIDDPKLGVLKKLKGYYKPFVKWTIVFILLHNVFVAMHIIDSSNIYTWGETIKRCLRAFVLSDGEGLLFQYWFLVSLTIASITSILLLWFLKRYKLLNNISLVGGGNSLGGNGFVDSTLYANIHIWSSNTPRTYRSADVPCVCILRQRIYV